METSSREGTTRRDEEGEGRRVQVGRRGGSKKRERGRGRGLHRNSILYRDGAHPVGVLGVSVAVGDDGGGVAAAPVRPRVVDRRQCGGGGRRCRKGGRREQQQRTRERGAAALLCFHRFRVGALLFVCGVGTRVSDGVGSQGGKEEGTER